jgi:hypothetical protein
MKKAFFTFHGNLKDFLRSAHSDPWITCYYQGSQSVKHLIESLHVPHPEVGEISNNGVPIDQSYIVQDRDWIEVFPFQLNEHLTQDEARFVLDNHLGKLAAYLRILGFDADYRNDFQDDELALVSSQEARILLTRDRGLLMRKIVMQGYCLRSLNPIQQLDEVVYRYHLAPIIHPFQRCVHCNHQLQPVGKIEVLERLEPLTRKYFNEFHICQACNQIYWKGSHYERLVKFITNHYANEE